MENLELEAYTPISAQQELPIANPAVPPTIELFNEDDEKAKIIAALKQTKNNKTKAAQLLKVDRKTLYNKIKLYDIDA